MSDAESVWHCLGAGQARDESARVPFFVGRAEVGSVSRSHLEVLAEFDALTLEDDAVRLTVPAKRRDEVLAGLHAQLRDRGLLIGWRDEIFPLIDPASGAVLARMERAAARFWGALTLGAHATGYVAGPDGRPQQLWIAQRSLAKSTDPGLFDNLVGGGVPYGQTPDEALVREGWEEAGLTAAQMQAARPGRLVWLQRDIPEGRQNELVSSYDLALPAGVQPHNQDGEVAAFLLLPVPEALALAAGEGMTVDAALVTLDFALRHRLLPADQHERLAARMCAYWLDD